MLAQCRFSKTAVNAPAADAGARGLSNCGRAGTRRLLHTATFRSCDDFFRTRVGADEAPSGLAASLRRPRGQAFHPADEGREKRGRRRLR